jgi:transposase
VRHRTRSGPVAAPRAVAPQEDRPRRTLASRRCAVRRSRIEAGAADRRPPLATLDDEIANLDAHIKTILDAIAPELLAVHGVSYETAGQLLVTAGDNPERLRRERSFAALCGATPVKASSGKTKRHRLNRGGDRNANAALWSIVLTRMVRHEPTRAYVERRTTEGLSRPEIMRCLKRYVARELYPMICDVADQRPIAIAA